MLQVAVGLLSTHGECIHVEFSNRKRKELEQECVQRHFGRCSTCFVYDTAVYRSCSVLLLQHGMRLAMQENGGSQPSSGRRKEYCHKLKL